MTTYSSREEIDEQYRWDLSSIFESDEAFLAALEEAKKLPPRFASFQGKISASAAELLAYLKLDDEAGLILTKLVNEEVLEFWSSGSTTMYGLKGAGKQAHTEGED